MAHHQIACGCNQESLYFHFANKYFCCKDSLFDTFFKNISIWYFNTVKIQNNITHNVQKTKNTLPVTESELTASSGFPSKTNALHLHSIWPQVYHPVCRFL